MYCVIILEIRNLDRKIPEKIPEPLTFVLLNKQGPVLCKKKKSI